MKILINGQATEIGENINIADLLKDQGYEDMLVAVAINKEFVSKTRRCDTKITEGDEIEIVAPMQGG